MIQITEQQAREMLAIKHYADITKSTLIVFGSICTDNLIDAWKEVGYIKKSALNEAREYFVNKNRSFKYDLQYLANLYEQAIEEIRDEHK